MSSATRTTKPPYFSFHRSSTPMPYSVGKPILNCCGGSLSTFGNMNRPVAASAAADAAENAPHARPSHARRVSSGDVSSGSRVAAFAAAGAGFAAAAPPGDATFVVLPARSGIGEAGGRGAAGLTPCAPPAAGARRGAQTADHHIGDRIAILVLPYVALDRLLDVRPIEHLAKHWHAVVIAFARERHRGVPAHVGRRILKRRTERRQLRLARQRAERV